MLLLILKNRFWSITVFICSFSLLNFAGESKQELKFNTQGKLKVVQFTDIHWKNGSPQNDNLLEVITNILEMEQPDLVVLTGDIITSKPAKNGWHSVVRPLIDRNIYWVVTLGNHDDEYDLARAETINFLEKLPYSLVNSGPKNIGGFGNFVLEIKDSGGHKNSADLYFFDSNTYSSIKGVGQYGWLKFEQIEWFRQTSKQLSIANNNKPFPGLAFFHIPFPEYNEVWTSSDSTCIGTKNENVCAPVINTGMFAAMRESKDVIGVFVGHDHENDYAGVLHDICLAYGRVTGFDAYGSLSRGARVIELVEGKREFTSWIRTENGEVLNHIHFPNSFKKKK